MSKIKCSECGKPVSSEVPDDIILRAWVECPECTKLVKSTRQRKELKEIFDKAEELERESIKVRAELKRLFPLYFH